MQYSEILEKIIDSFIDKIPSITLILLVLLISFIIIFSRIYKVSTEKSKWNITKYEKTHKYIKKIFIEINDYKEILRYFVFGKKWKNRIKNKFNSLFKIKPKFVNFKLIISRIYWFNSFKKIVGIIKKQYDIFEKAFKNEKNIGIDDCPHAEYKAEDYAYWIQKELGMLNEYCMAMNANLLMLIGNAGSGKSNLICNITETIIDNKYSCAFINLKDVDRNIYESFYEFLPLNKFLKFLCDKLGNIVSILSIINIVYKFKRQKFFILLDALNEKNNIDFLTTISKFINDLLEYKSFKVVLTCRSEYFDTYYYKILEKNINMTNNNIVRLNISNDDKNFLGRNKFKLHQAYRKHFNFNGTISEYVYNKMSQLLLIRIMYEVNKNSNRSITTLNKFEMYRNYVNLIAEDNEEIEMLLNIITKKMIDDLNFGYISITDLGLEDEQIMLLRKICD